MLAREKTVRKASPSRKPGAPQSALPVPVSAARRKTDLDRKTVNQSNSMIQSCYSLTLNEKRLLIMAGSEIKPGGPAAVRVNAKEFAKVFGIGSRGHAYEVLEDAAVRLYARSIKSIEKTASGMPVQERRWLTGRAMYENGSVLLEFNESIVQDMVLLTNATSYPLKQISGLSSFYAIRLYEIIEAERKAHVSEPYLDLARLRDMLDLGGKYPNVKDLRRWIIDPAMKEISAKSDMNCEAEPVRKGRTVIGFKIVALG